MECPNLHPNPITHRSTNILPDFLSHNIAYIHGEFGDKYQTCINHYKRFLTFLLHFAIHAAANIITNMDTDLFAYIIPDGNRSVS